MKNTPKISVIITSYNVQNYIESTIKSIQEQTFKDIEIIIVDDGSSDKSPVIIKKYSTLDERIKPILLEGRSIGGVSTAANAGIKKATGLYIAFADGDDLYDKNFLELMWTSVSEFNPDISICDYDDFHDKTFDIILPSDSHCWETLPKENYFLVNKNERLSLLSLSPVPWRKIYKREFLINNKIFFPVVDRFFEDNPFHWNVLMNAKTCSTVRKRLCHHRLHRAGQTMEVNNPKAFEVLDHFPDLLKTLNSSHENDEDYNLYLFKWLIGNTMWVASINSNKSYKLLMQLSKKYLLHFDAKTIIKWYKKGLIKTNEVFFYESIIRKNAKLLSNSMNEKKGLLLMKFLVLSKYEKRKSLIKNHIKNRAKNLINRIFKTKENIEINQSIINHIEAIRLINTIKNNEK